MFGVPPVVLSLLRQMGSYLQVAIRQAAVDSAEGVRPDPDKLAIWMEDHMADWQPKVKDRDLADPGTRKAAARLLAGLACNLVSPGAANERAA